MQQTSTMATPCAAAAQRQTDVERVPQIQKELIKLCNKRGKPVITATEMLKSMTDRIEPTPAEGSDVFNAVVDGTDAVMTSESELSGGGCS